MKTTSSHPQRHLSALQFLKPPHVLILEARYYNEINDGLLTGATEFLSGVGASFEKITVPGALEIPTALQFASLRQNGRGFDAYIALGCVLRGETFHFNIVATESARALIDVSLRHNLAIGNGILTCETRAQAEERADPARQNKGGEAANAALTMLHLKQICGLE